MSQNNSNKEEKTTDNYISSALLKRTKDDAAIDHRKHSFQIPKVKSKEG